MWSCLSIISLLAEAGDAASNTGDSGSGGAGQPSFGPMMWMIPIFIIFIIFQMMFNNPQKKEKKRLDELKNRLKKNDPIETAGGILGTVVELHADKEEVTIKVDDNLRLRMRLRSVYARTTTDGKSTADSPAPESTPSN